MSSFRAGCPYISQSKFWQKALEISILHTKAGGKNPVSVAINSQE